MFARFKRKKFLLLALVLVAGLAAFSYFGGSPGSPVSYLQKLTDRLAPVHGALARFRRGIFRSSDEEELRLREENTQLRERLVALEEEKKTWEGWQQIRSDLYRDIPRGVAARVIAGEASPQRRSVTLDKGLRHGLREGQTVLAQGGLVGRLVRVSEQTSQALLLTDPFSVVDVLSQSSRSRGTLKGEGYSLNLGGEYFLARDPLQEGDLLLTSGQDGIFPKGIPVGVVHGLQKDESGIFYRAKVETIVEMKKLEMVEVI
jgi:rod shape-determining protein MreC